MENKELPMNSPESLFSKVVDIFAKQYRVIIIFSLWVLLFAPVFPELFKDYFAEPDNSHGILVPLIAVYMVFQKKDQIRSAKWDSSNSGLILLCLSLALYLIGRAGGILVLQRVTMIFSFICVVLYIFGIEIFKILLFPLFFLLFMVPLPVSIVGLVSFPLQLLATRSSEIIIQEFGIPVFREGNMLYFLQTQLEVAEACSGIRSIMSLIMLSLIFVNFSRYGWPHKAILIFSAIPVAMLANIVRVSGTGILAHFYGGKVARGFLHEFSGLAVFAFGLSLLYFEYRILEKVWPKRENGKLENQ